MQHPKTRRGFTLIELLVVILIIGILAAVALPQYQKAVQKAKLARIIPLTKAFYLAEETYFLENGNYTQNLSLLNVEMPTHCESKGNYYDCVDFLVGAWDNNNVQVILREDGQSVISYRHYFAPETTNPEINKGSIVCASKITSNRQVCQNLGKGHEINIPSENWIYAYLLD